jgi:hypothetical protein
MTDVSIEIKEKLKLEFGLSLLGMKQLPGGWK